MIREFFDLIAPRMCCICGRRLDASEHIICTVCLAHLPLTGFLDHPYENNMAKVFWGRVKDFQKAFALMYHLSHADSAKAVYQLKYAGFFDIGIEMGYLMGRMMSEKNFFADIDALLPVPLAKKRLKERGYNQSAMIALGIHDATGLPILKNVVRRKSFEGSQTTKSRLDRAENVDAVFELVKPSAVCGRHLLVIDDVVTTGATICALAAQLQQAGGVRISVASLSYAGQWHADGDGDFDENTPGDEK